MLLQRISISNGGLRTTDAAGRGLPDSREPVAVLQFRTAGNPESLADFDLLTAGRPARGESEPDLWLNLGRRLA